MTMVVPVARSSRMKAMQRVAYKSHTMELLDRIEMKTQSTETTGGVTLAQAEKKVVVEDTNLQGLVKEEDDIDTENGAADRLV